MVMASYTSMDVEIRKMVWKGKEIYQTEKERMSIYVPKK
jgi:hypothetical protein